MKVEYKLSFICSFADAHLKIRSRGGETTCLTVANTSQEMWSTMSS